MKTLIALLLFSTFAGAQTPAVRHSIGVVITTNPPKYFEYPVDYGVVYIDSNQLKSLPSLNFPSVDDTLKGGKNKAGVINFSELRMRVDTILRVAPPPSTIDSLQMLTINVGINKRYAVVCFTDDNKPGFFKYISYTSSNKALFTITKKRGMPTSFTVKGISAGRGIGTVRVINLAGKTITKTFEVLVEPNNDTSYIKLILK